jgi:hypothetical protein
MLKIKKLCQKPCCKCRRNPEMQHGFFRLKEKGIRLKVLILFDLNGVLMKDIDKNFPLFP